MCPQTHELIKKTQCENREKPSILKAQLRFATETSYGIDEETEAISATQVRALIK